MLRPVADDLQALRASLYRWADKVLAARGGEDRLVYVIAMLGLLRAAQGGGPGGRSLASARGTNRGLDLAGGGDKSAKLGAGQASVCR